MRSFGIPRAPAAIVEMRQSTFVRCLCPECMRLDARHPGEGYQLGLFPYRMSAPMRFKSAPIGGGS